MGKTKKSGYVFVDRDHMGQNSYEYFPTKEKGEQAVLKFVNDFMASDEVYEEDREEPFTDCEKAIEWYNELDQNLDAGYHIELEKCN